jgi:hypothetical protein
LTLAAGCIGRSIWRLEPAKPSNSIELMGFDIAPNQDGGGNTIQAAALRAMP